MWIARTANDTAWSSIGKIFLSVNNINIIRQRSMGRFASTWCVQTGQHTSDVFTVRLGWWDKGTLLCILSIIIVITSMLIKIFLITWYPVALVVRENLFASYMCTFRAIDRNSTGMITLSHPNAAAMLDMLKLNLCLENDCSKKY